MAKLEMSRTAMHGARPSVEICLLVKGVPYPECLARLPDGWLLASCGGNTYLEPGPIYAFSSREGASPRVFADIGCRFLGIVALEDGTVIGCDATQGRLVWLSPAGRVVETVAEIGGWRLRKPNGIAVGPDDSIWIADSGSAQAGEPTAAVLSLDAEGVGRVAAVGLTYANGIAVLPHGEGVVVTETRDNRLLCFRTSGSGTLAAKELFADRLGEGPDGVSVDSSGTVYVAVTQSAGVASVDAQGSATWLAVDASELRMPSHAYVLGAGELAVCSLFADTVHLLRWDSGVGSTDGAMDLTSKGRRV
jgi:DNA-binding beta-propeller fold protein YncE